VKTKRLNRAIKALKNLLKTERNQRIQRYLNLLSPSTETNYSLWKVTKRFIRSQTQFLPVRKQDERWVRSDNEKPKEFAAHFSKVFEPHPHEITIDEEKKLLTDTNIPVKMVALAKPFTINEVRTAIRILNQKKASDYNLITNQILQKLPEKGIRFISQHSTETRLFPISMESSKSS